MYSKSVGLKCNNGGPFILDSHIDFLQFKDIDNQLFIPSLLIGPIWSWLYILNP